MQIARFSNGSFAVHAIKSNKGARISAWYNDDGAVIDVEKVLSNGTTTTRLNTNDRMAVKIAGSVYKPNKTLDIEHHPV